MYLTPKSLTTYMYIKRLIMAEEAVGFLQLQVFYLQGNVLVTMPIGHMTL